MPKGREIAVSITLYMCLYKKHICEKSNVMSIHRSWLLIWTLACVLPGLDRSFEKGNSEVTQSKVI